MKNGFCLTHVQTTPNRVFLLKTLKCSANIPARDTPIDFGKHKGKPLGTLPPGYLRWVSQNLRAGDFLRWAGLADEVLRDPVYRDRTEWELARGLLSGDRLSSGGDGKAVSYALAELCERFGWDNGDAEGWRRVDFAMLGTSRSGRIPRKRGGEGEGEGEDGKVEEKGEGKRAERRERARLRRRNDNLGGLGARGKRQGLGENKEDDERKEIGNSSSLFPGRRGLLQSVRKRFS